MSESVRNNLLTWLSRETSNGRKAKGCFVVGRLVVEGEPVPKDVATRTWLEDDGQFVALVAPRRTLAFMKHGYRTLEIAVPEANGEWDGAAVYDYGIVTLKRLAKDESSKVSCDVTLPNGVREVEARLSLYNDIPIRSDWGTFGRERPSVLAVRKTFAADEKVGFENCADAAYDLELSAASCVVFRRQLKTTEREIGPVALRRVQGAVFAIRPFAGGSWQKQAVLVDGRNVLLVKDEPDEWGNRGARIHLDPYKSSEGVGFHFGFGPDYYEDFGALTTKAFEKAERDGTLPEPTKLKYEDRVFLPGHIYRMQEKHWKIDLLISFDFYGSEREFEAYTEKLGRQEKIKVVDEAVSSFDYEARFPEDVPVGVELKRAGKAAESAIAAKRAKLRDARQYIPGLPHEFSVATTKADARRAMAELDRRVGDYLKVLTSATGRWALKRDEKEKLVRRTKRDTLEFLQYVLFARRPAEPVAETMRRRIEQLKRELGDAKTRGSRSREGK